MIKRHLDADYFTCVGLSITVAAGIFFHAKPGQVETLSNLNRIPGFPLISNIIRGVSVWHENLLGKTMSLKSNLKPMETLPFSADTRFSYSQLAIFNEHVCLSIGYSFKFIGQDKVKEILQQ